MIFSAGSSAETSGVARRFYAHTRTHRFSLPVPANSRPSDSNSNSFYFIWRLLCCLLLIFLNDSPAIRHRLLFFSTVSS